MTVLTLDSTRSIIDNTTPKSKQKGYKRATITTVIKVYLIVTEIALQLKKEQYIKYCFSHVYFCLMFFLFPQGSSAGNQKTSPPRTRSRHFDGGYKACGGHWHRRTGDNSSPSFNSYSESPAVSVNFPRKMC